MSANTFLQAQPLTPLLPEPLFHFISQAKAWKKPKQFVGNNSKFKPIYKTGYKTLQWESSPITTQPSSQKAFPARFDNTPSTVS